MVGMAPKKGCICQICNCGRHHCPLHSNVLTKNPTSPCLLSEYRDEFLHRPAEPVEAIRPKQNKIGSGDALSDKTTNRVDYVPWDQRPPANCKPVPRPLPPGELDSDTTYRKDYPGKSAPPMQPFKPKPGKRSTGEFRGQPTYRSEYRKWDLPEKTSRPPQRPFRSDAPFEGLTTVGTDYTGKSAPPAESQKPKESALKSGDPMADDTSYKTDYVKHKQEKMQLPDRNQYCPNDAPFDGLTNYRNDYIHRPGAPSEPLRPAQKMIDKSQPMSDTTTNRKDYVPWDQRPPKACGPYYKPLPAGCLESDTTYQTNYVPHDAAPSKPFMPKNKKRDPGPFNGHTSYRGDYRSWDLPDKFNAPPQRPFRSDAPFDGITTVNTDYVNHGQVPPPDSCAPDKVYKPKCDPMEHCTSYRTDYIPKRLDVCPAALLDTRATAYVYRGADPVGHKHYERISELNLAKSEGPARMEAIQTTAPA